MSSIEDAQTLALKSQISLLKTQFDELDRVNVRAIPEAMFVHHFLPFFAGETQENSQEIIGNWLTVAGSAINPVNVVDRAGRVVIQVPPIQNSESLDPTAISNVNLAYTAKESGAMSSLSPQAAQNIMSAGLGVKLTAMTKDIQKSNEAHEKKWDDLLVHYGKKKPVTGNKDNSAGSEDIFGY
jgi:hypothetical protein